MTTKAEFTTEEWSQLLGSVMMAGMAVTLADPSGLIGMTKEGIASGSALIAAKSDPNANALVKAAVADAAGEGGFLGFGGVRVSDAEKATLADIAKALKQPV